MSVYISEVGNSYLGTMNINYSDFSQPLERGASDSRVANPKAHTHRPRQVPAAGWLQYNLPGDTDTQYDLPGDTDTGH